MAYDYVKKPIWNISVLDIEIIVAHVLSLVGE
jgi:hypothetical protein